MKFKVSLFKHRADSVPRPVERTWAQICGKIPRPSVRPEKDGPLFSPADFEPLQRLLKNVREVSLLVLDYDHDAEFEGDLQSWRELGCAFAAHTTFNHTVGAHRFRVIIPLATPISGADFPRLWKWASQVSSGKIDSSASDASRMFYVPVRSSEDAAYLFEIQEGKLLDWLKLDLPPIEIVQTAVPRESGTRDVDGLLRKAFAAKNGAETFRLFEGDISQFGGDQSRADMALASRLAFFAGPEPSTLEEMLRRSRLAREKWNQQHYGDGRSYLQGVVDKAFSGKTEFYSANGNGNGTYSPAAREEESDFSRVADWPELAHAALHGLPGEIAQTLEPHTEADLAALLIQTLAAYGNVIGRSAYFKAEADWHHTNLFVVLVGLTSKGRKGTSLSHVRRLFSKVDENWNANCLYNGLSSGEGLIHVVRDPSEKKEPVKDKGKVVSYQTVVVDHGVDDKRAFVIEPEFASVLRVMARDGATLSAILRQGWDGGKLRVMSRNTAAIATGALISIVGHITGDELSRNLDQTERANGFANRFLWVCVRRSKYLPEGGSLSDAELNPLVERLRQALEFGRSVHELKRDGQAASLWREIYPALSEGYPGMLGVVTSRAEAQTMRLACVYALMDRSSVIRRVHLQAALALWQYCEDSARYVFGDAVGDRLSDEILGALREAADVGLTRTQIRDLFRRNIDSDRIALALKCLAENGLAQNRKESGDGRPVQRWFAVETKSAPKASYIKAPSESSSDNVLYIPPGASDEDVEAICGVRT